jgi:tetratricopeptide (TPR) repeat protein
MTEWERASEILEAALARPDKADPAHPTLAERLDALGLIPELPPPVSQSAAGLLGASLPKVLEHFDAAWRDAAAPAWRRAYGKLKPETRRLLDLDAAAAAKPLDLAPAIERARLAYLAAGLEASRERYADLIEWHPQDARAALAAGLAMIDGGDADGAECLRQALELAPRTDWTRANAEDWFAVGEALLGGGDDLGIDCLEQAIRIDPARTDLASFLVDRYLDRDPSAVHAA